MKENVQFIVIDDDSVSNLLAQIVIKGALHIETFIRTFTSPEVGLDTISNEYLELMEGPTTVLLLDINMPVWSGWDFLDHFEKLSEKIKSKIRIYMLSSSLDTADKVRALNNKNVIDYIIKPITAKAVLSIISKETPLITT